MITDAIRSLVGVTRRVALGTCYTALTACQSGPPQPQSQASGTAAEFRGLSAAGPEVVWAAGRNGTFARTQDGGATWVADTVPGAASLFFIDVHAVDQNTAILLGTHFDGGLAKIFRTDDAGSSWVEAYSDSHEGVFFDGLAFWDADHGVAFSDPVDGGFLVVTTADGGLSWQPVPPESLPPPQAGEAGFAASGTAIAVQGTRHVWFGTGGGAVARVYHSSDRGRSWTVAETPLAAGPTAGIFGIAFRDTLNGVAVGGDYRDPKGAGVNVARTHDGGRTWTLAGKSEPQGVRYGAAYTRGTGDAVLVAVGPSGWGYSHDDGATWTAIDTLGYNTIAAADREARVWVAGVEGRITTLQLQRRGAPGY